MTATPTPTPDPYEVMRAGAPYGQHQVKASPAYPAGPAGPYDTDQLRQHGYRVQAAPAEVEPTAGQLIAPAAPAEVEPEPERVQADISALIMQIPAKRWFAIRRALNMTADEIMDDLIAMTVVAANEHQRGTETVQGAKPRDAYERFLDMTLPELQDYLGIKSPPAPEGQESDEDGRSGDDGGLA